MQSLLSLDFSGNDKKHVLGCSNANVSGTIYYFFEEKVMDTKYLCEKNLQIHIAFIQSKKIPKHHIFILESENTKR